MADEVADVRDTKPGRKRLLITVATLISFVIGSPFWYKSTQVYRAPLPFDDIDSYAAWASSTSIQQRCQLNVIFALGWDHAFSKAKLDSLAAGIQLHIQRSIGTSSLQTCKAGFELLVTLDAPTECLRSGDDQGIASWPCGLGEPSLLKLLHLSENDAVDELLWNFSNTHIDSLTANFSHLRPGYEGGVYSIVVLQKEDVIGGEVCGNSDREGGDLCTSKKNSMRHAVDPTKSASLWRTVLGKYRHGWISGQFISFTDEAELSGRIGDVATNFFGGSKVGSTQENVSSIPLSADGEAILSFSLLNAEPNDWIFDWDFEELEESFLLPVVVALKNIAQLNVESQVLYYTPKAVQSQWVPPLRSHVVTSKQLPFFVNANEWHLDSSSAAAGRSKILHFAIYVPAANEWPLRMQSADGRISPTNAFTSPGWGGVVVWNPVRPTPVLIGDRPPVTVLDSKDFEVLARVFVAQLRTLVGLPPTVVEDKKAQVFGLPSPKTGFADWEVDVLLRRRVIADVEGAASTLKSLSRLVRKLPNMLIMDEISNQVKMSMAAATAARASAAQGVYNATAEFARTARSLAEAAFFHPSIMSLLYNPTEHHLAIYTPFFVPVLLHAVLAVVKEVSHHRREWKKFKQKQKQQ